MSTSKIDLAAALSLYKAGHYNQCYQAFGGVDPVELTGTRERILFARLASNLEAPRLAKWLCVRAYQKDRDDPEARYYYLRTLVDRGRPLAAWTLAKQLGDPVDGSPEIQASWFGLTAVTAAILRDFETAYRRLGQALSIGADQEWIYVEECVIHEMADRYEEAHASARRSLELVPWFRPGVQATARTLKLLGRNDESLDLLTEAIEHMESPAVVNGLAHDQIEREMYESASKSLDRYEQLAVLIEPAMRKGLEISRSTVAYHLGDYPKAAEHARATEVDFFNLLAGNIESATANSRRVVLPVAFVRQHHMTCAPATLTAIARFWSKQADHLEVAEEICYGGTQAYNERLWAEQNGWATREFTVTWDSARALIDSGIPFTLTTVGIASAHLQAVIGYDERRGTLLIRDPFHFFISEGLAEGFLRSQSPFGPRGMALVPVEKRHLLDAIDLPETVLHDGFHHVQIALKEHDRASAWTAFLAMEDAVPDHRLTLNARRTIAYYDADLAEQLVCVEKLLDLFQNEPNLLLSRVALMQALSMTVDYEAALVEYCFPKDKTIARIENEDKARDEAAVDADHWYKAALPLFWQRYADLLRGDARTHDKALHLLRRGLRRWPVNSSILGGIAEIKWSQRQFSEAEELFRFAACIEDKDEGCVRRYFGAAQHLKHADDVLGMLNDRFARLGAQSSFPARTLFAALSAVGLQAEAYDVVDKALSLRPDDGPLYLFAAERRVDIGQFAKARELLELCRRNTRPAAWRRAAARLAMGEQDRPQAIELWREVLASEPLAMDAHFSVATLLAETAGTDAVKDHFREATARFPYHFELHQLFADWLRRAGDSGAREQTLRHMLSVNERNGWTRRELANLLTDQKRFDEASEQIEAAAGLEPNSPMYFNTLGAFLVSRQQWPEAREALRSAIRLDIDDDYAVRRLISLASTPAEIRAELGFVEAELARQTTFGAGLRAFRAVASEVLQPSELLLAVQKALDARPDLWHAWSCVVQLLVTSSQYDEALAVARQATERYPLNAQLWMDLASVYEATGRSQDERSALRKALEVNPGWTAPTRKLCSSFERAGDYAAAKELMEDAVRRVPLDARNHGKLADVLMRLGENIAAFDELIAAVELDDDYDWAWDRIGDCANNLDRTAELEGMIRGMIEKKPEAVHLKRLLAETMHERVDEQVAVLNSALEIDPQAMDIRDFLAQVLVSAGRFDEALHACASPSTAVPIPLRGRSAWVTHQSGDKAAGAQRMREVVNDDPQYFWGWHKLANWASDEGRVTEYHRAAKMMTEIRPQDPVAIATLADAERASGNIPAARAAFARALELRPRYQFALKRLFEICMSAGDLDVAEALVKTYGAAVAADGGDVGMTIEIEAGRGNIPYALELFGGLVKQNGSPMVVRPAVAALSAKGAAPQVESLLREAVCHIDVAEGVPSLWLETAERIDYELVPATLPLMRPLAAIEVARHYVHDIGSKLDTTRVDRLLKTSAEWLRSEDVLWGAVGYALTRLERRKETFVWMSDWRQRAGAKPWMLVNFVEAALLLGNDQEMRAACRHALTLPRDNGSELHELWVGFDAGMDGDFQASAKAAANIRRQLTEEYIFIHQLIVAMGTLARGASAFPDAQRGVEQARSIFPDYKRYPLCRAAYKPTVERIASAVNTIASKMWGLAASRFG